jgi:hypothetical protein
MALPLIRVLFSKHPDRSVGNYLTILSLTEAPLGRPEIARRFNALSLPTSHLELD